MICAISITKSSNIFARRSGGRVFCMKSKESLVKILYYRLCGTELRKQKVGLIR